MSELAALAAVIVQQAQAIGATEAECTVSEGQEFSVSVRMGEVEELTQAGSRGAGIRVLVGQNSGSSQTSDLTAEGINRMVRTALELARITTPDPFADLPEASTLGAYPGDLELYDEEIERLDTTWKIALAREAERVALAADPRIQNSDGGAFSSYLGERAFANTRGFVGSYRTSSCGLHVSPVARSGDSMERDYWHTSSRKAKNLESAEHVGKKAAERTLLRLNPRKVDTQKAPVVFDTRSAAALLSELFDAMQGGAIYRDASFLCGKLGEKIASDRLTIVDDATLPGLFGSVPFDDEGVRSQRTMVVERGVLSSYLLNSYCARKLKMRTTANASRGLSGAPSVNNGNFFIAPGVHSEMELFAPMKQGLYLTRMIGVNADVSTGDFSAGASGLWIEGGELAYPVAEITVAGNLEDMLMGIDAVASNLEFRGAICAPSIRIAEMTISGR